MVSDNVSTNKIDCFNDPTPRESLWWGGVADSKNFKQLWELDQNSGSWINYNKKKLCTEKQGCGHKIS